MHRTSLRSFFFSVEHRSEFVSGKDQVLVVSLRQVSVWRLERCLCDIVAFSPDASVALVSKGLAEARGARAGCARALAAARGAGRVRNRIGGQYQMLSHSRLRCCGKLLPRLATSLVRVRG
jgi:hypothetical protein